MVLFCFVLFYGISTLVGCLIPSPVNIYIYIYIIIIIIIIIINNNNFVGNIILKHARVKCAGLGTTAVAES